MTKVRFTYEPISEQQYGGPTWVLVSVDGRPVARVERINGPPFLSAVEVIEADPPIVSRIMPALADGMVFDA